MKSILAPVVGFLLVSLGSGFWAYSRLTFRVDAAEVVFTKLETRQEKLERSYNELHDCLVTNSFYLRVIDAKLDKIDKILNK